MIVGIVVYSGRGHTYKAACQLEKILEAAGHQVVFERLTASGALLVIPPSYTSMSKPSLADCDAIVFCSPVYGGLLAKSMLSYLDGISSLSGMKAAGLVTHFFPHKWGADQALSTLKAVCEMKGAHYCVSSDVRWFGFTLKRKMTQAAEEILRALG